MSENIISMLPIEEGMTSKQQEAISLHYEIRKNGELAASALVEFAKGLKKMRDEGLYKDLGFESFEDYSEQAVGLKQRQAYNYISALERLGPSVLQSNAKLGITKLMLLSEINPIDRQDFIDNNDIDNISTREMKDIVDELTSAKEQLSFLQSEKEEIAESAKNEKEAKKALEGRIIELERKLKDEQNKPADIAVAEPDPQQIQALADKIVSQEIKKYQKDAEEAKKAAVEEAKKKAVEKAAKDYEAAINAQKEAEREKKRAIERAMEIEKKLKLTSSPETIKFTVLFESLKNNLNQLIEQLNVIRAGGDKETADKLTASMQKFAELLRSEING